MATTKAATAWGEAEVVDEVAVPQVAGDKEFAAVVQLLRADGVGELVRFAYTTDGKARRGPVTLRAEDVARLCEALGKHPELARALSLGPRSSKGGGRRRKPS